MIVKITPADSPPGKLADVELHFEPGEPLAGLKLVGFAVWETRTGHRRNVTYPARQYSHDGERRSFALLRPVADVAASDAVRDAVLQAYASFVADWTPAVPVPEMNKEVCNDWYALDALLTRLHAEGWLPAEILVTTIFRANGAGYNHPAYLVTWWRTRSLEAVVNN